MKETGEEKKRETMEKLDEAMRRFAREREKLNQMSSERIALGKPLTDEALLAQSRACCEIGVSITQLQEFLDEIEGG